MTAAPGFSRLRRPASVRDRFGTNDTIAMTDHTPDMFGWTPAQGDLFGDAAPASTVPQVDPDEVRRRLHGMLAQVRAAQKRSPWPPETTRLNQLIFPQMANWLPPEERDQLRFAFETELKRLNVAA